jgi:hypothetical protein
MAVPENVASARAWIDGYKQRTVSFRRSRYGRFASAHLRWCRVAARGWRARALQARGIAAAAA